MHVAQQHCHDGLEFNDRNYNMYQAMFIPLLDLTIQLSVLDSPPTPRMRFHFCNAYSGDGDVHGVRHSSLAGRELTPLGEPEGMGAGEGPGTPPRL